MPPAPDADAAWRAARRRVAREHHPDLGGDTEAYLAALRAVDVAHGRPVGSTGGSPAPGPTVRGRTSARRRALRVALRTGRDVTRAVRSRIPRGLPGARRYGRY